MKIKLLIIVLLFNFNIYAQEKLRVGVLAYGTVNWELEVLKNNALDKKNDFELEVVKLASKNAVAIALPNSYSYLKDARFFVSDTVLNKAYTVTNYFVEIDFDTNAISRYSEFSPYLNETKPNPLIRLKDGSFLTGYMLSKLIRIHPEKK